MIPQFDELFLMNTVKTFSEFGFIGISIGEKMSERITKSYCRIVLRWEDKAGRITDSCVSKPVIKRSFFRYLG